MEQELAARLSEWQIAELVENDEVHSSELIRDPTLPSVPGLDLEAVDEIDHVVEPATGAGADAASGDGNGQMSLAGTGAADQHGVEVLGERQFGDSELVFDRPRLLLVDLGAEQITDDTLRFMLAFDSGGHYLVEGSLHAVELEFAHEVEELSAFH